MSTNNIKPITKDNKDEWIMWLKDQLDTTNNAEYAKTGNNRVFLTQEDDIDIARFILGTFLVTVEDIPD